MRVFNKGIALTTTPSNSNSGFNVPTNPVLIDDAGMLLGSTYNRLAAIVKEDGTITNTMVEQALIIITYLLLKDIGLNAMMTLLRQGIELTLSI